MSALFAVKSIAGQVAVTQGTATVEQAMALADRLGRTAALGPFRQLVSSGTYGVELRFKSKPSSTPSLWKTWLPL